MCPNSAGGSGRGIGKKCTSTLGKTYNLRDSPYSEGSSKEGGWDLPELAQSVYLKECAAPGQVPAKHQPDLDSSESARV
jgi:hypothetical protein